MATTKQKIPSVRSAGRKVNEASTQLNKAGLTKLGERAEKLAQAIDAVLARMDKMAASVDATKKRRGR